MPLPYIAQKKDFNDTTTSQTWFVSEFVPEVRNRTSKNEEIFMDNDSSNGSIMEVAK